MTTEEVKHIIKESGRSVINVSIITESGKKFRQSLRINAINQLCIGQYKSSYPNYIISDLITAKWKEVKII